MARPFLSRLGALALGLALLGACSEDGTLPTGVSAAQGQVPTLTGIDLQNLGNSVVTLKARAIDPQGATLTYAWKVDQGGLSSTTAAAVQWLTPKTAGTYTATVVVSNPAGGSVSGSQGFTVTADGQVATTGGLSVQTRAATATTSAGGITIPSPLGSQVPNAVIVGGVANPTPSVAPLTPFGQSVATPEPGSTPLPPLPAQPIATPTPTAPPQILPPSALPTAKPPTPEPGVPIPPPLRWRQYSPQKVPLTGISLSALHFPKPSRGWFAGSNGAIMLYNETDPAVEPALVFRNGGIPAGERINKIFFTSDDVGYAAADRAIYRTTDAGVTWTSIGGNLAGTNGTITSLVVHNEQIVSLATNAGTIYRTQSANAAVAADVFWQTINTQPGDRPIDRTNRLSAGAPSPVDSSLSFFGGDGFYKLDADNPDPTQVWRRMLSLDTAVPGTAQIGDGEVTAIEMPSASDIWVATSTGNLIITSDGGGTWRKLQRDQYKDREFNGGRTMLNTTSGLAALRVLDAQHAFFGTVGAVYDTNDAAQSWRSLSTASFGAIDMFVTDIDGKRDFGGWALASGSSIYRYRAGF